MQKLLLLVGLCVLVAHLEATGSRKLVCTFQSVPTFDMATDMDPQLCTHIVFKSVQPNAMVIPQTGGPIQDHQDFKAAFPSATAKTLLEVDLTQTSSAIFTAPNRATFITSVIGVLVAEDFDGVNILWLQTMGNTANRHRFTLLMQELKAALGTRLLTASVSGVPSEINASYEVPQLAEVVDCFNVMTADRDRTVPDTDAAATGAALPFPATIAGMQKLVVEGAPEAKLNMGIATYGVDTKPNANPRILPKYQVCVALAPPTTVRVDSDATIDAKAQHIVTHNFGGAYMTCLELDDFNGVCNEGHFPVIHRIKAII
uniref:Acidic mammalian chitinase-like n=1 Tax=Hippocampus comes TaxID=109280 RepID=A0A3Q2Z6U8_HIPCM